MRVKDPEQRLRSPKQRASQESGGLVGVKIGFGDVGTHHDGSFGHGVNPGQRDNPVGIGEEVEAGEDAEGRAREKKEIAVINGAAGVDPREPIDASRTECGRESDESGDEGNREARFGPRLEGGKDGSDNDAREGCGDEEADPKPMAVFIFANCPAKDAAERDEDVHEGKKLQRRAGQGRQRQ